MGEKPLTEQFVPLLQKPIITAKRHRKTFLIHWLGQSLSALGSVATTRRSNTVIHFSFVQNLNSSFAFAQNLSLLLLQII
jgi:hypothetical protein